MDVIQGEYQVSRKKIYTLSMKPDERFHSPEPEQSKNVMSATEVNFQLDRFRTLVREKDAELAKLKHELILLKQIERRQQKEIESFESQFDEAPKIIKSLQGEISHQKKKLKQYFTQIEKDSKHIASLDEDRKKLREQNEKLEKLNNEKNLLERSLLVKKLEEARIQAREAETRLEDNKKMYEVSSRNLGNDNRQLRGKINSMEKEIVILRDRTVSLDDVIKEKDKLIASLSIYRYNAIHRKVESICKTCLKREKAAAAIRRKNEILAKLPKLTAPVITVSSSTSVTVSVNIPQKSKTDGIEYSRLALIYSSDPAMQDNHKVLIDLEEHPTVSTKATIMAIHQDKETFSEKDMNTDKENSEKTCHRKVKVTNLESGRFYYFQLVAGFQDVDGSPTEAESVFVDGLPQPPTKLSTILNLEIPRITILSELGSSTGSPIQSYRLYHSVDPTMKPNFLVDEISVSNLTLEEGKIKFNFLNPELRISHYFYITTVNAMGESAPSIVSEKCVIDYVPSQPSKPIIRKLSSTSLKLSSQITPNGGSDVDFFIISVIKENGDSDLKIRTDSDILYGTNLEHVIDGLEMETNYKFQVVAHNVAGDSIPSEISDNIILDALVPVAESPHIEVLSTTSVKVIFPDISAIKKPEIKEFRISWSPTIDLNGDMATTTTCPASCSSFIVESLPECQTLFFGICLIGQTSEGLFCTPIAVHLASAISLPESIASTPRIGPSPLPPVSRSLSTLSLEQRAQNMHDGVPAHFQSLTQLENSPKNTGYRRYSQTDQAKRKPPSAKGSVSLEQIKVKNSKPVSNGPTSGGRSLPARKPKLL